MHGLLAPAQELSGDSIMLGDLGGCGAIDTTIATGVTVPAGELLGNNQEKKFFNRRKESYSP